MWCTFTSTLVYLYVLNGAEKWHLFGISIGIDWVTSDLGIPTNSWALCFTKAISKTSVMSHPSDEVSYHLKTHMFRKGVLIFDFQSWLSTMCRMLYPSESRCDTHIELKILWEKRIHLERPCLTVWLYTLLYNVFMWLKYRRKLQIYDECFLIDLYSNKLLDDHPLYIHCK